MMPISDFKVAQDYLKLTFFPFSFDIFRITFTSNKVVYFSQVNVFIACHLSKIYLQSESKGWSYLTKNFQFFILKKFEFLFKK